MKPRFLTSIKTRSLIGEYLPRNLKISEGKVEIDFSNAFNQDMGSVIFIMSESCGTCDYSPINQFVEKYSGFNYIMYLNAPEVSIEKILGMVHKNINTVKSDLMDLNDYFGFQTVPFVSGINSVGQIISCDHFNTVEQLEFILAPLLHVFFNGVE